MKSNILIIGNGFIGKKMFEYFNTKDFSNLEIHHIFNLQYFALPTVINVIENKLAFNKIDYVINCVGYTGTPNVDGCEDNKEDAWYLNVTLPSIIASICSKHNSKLINISSGCIYSGYEKEYTEEDTPNFGLHSENSSWYSKTKHACELNFNNFNNVYNFRIRMPITGNLNESKNYLTKILKYNNLINAINSKTVIDDLLDFTYSFINTDKNENLNTGNYNVVNPNPLNTEEIVEILDNFGFWNPNWKWIDLEDLYKNTKCQRSNCVLDTTYTQESTGILLPSERESIIEALSKYTN